MPYFENNSDMEKKISNLEVEQSRYTNAFDRALDLIRELHRENVKLHEKIEALQRHARAILDEEGE